MPRKSQTSKTSSAACRIPDSPLLMNTLSQQPSQKPKRIAVADLVEELALMSVYACGRLTATVTAASCCHPP